MESNEKLFCFDLEGPISLNDNCKDIAKELGLIRVFDILDRYDDILYYQKKSCIGSTLRFILPFFIEKKLDKSRMRQISEKTVLAKNIDAAIISAKQKGIMSIISTSYEIHSYAIGKKVGVKEENIYSTKINLDGILTPKDKELIENIIRQSVYLNKKSDSELEDYMNAFFSSISKPIEQIVNDTIVIGGFEKKQKADELMRKNNILGKNIVAIGDSIVDIEMLEFASAVGGFSLCINAKKEAIDSADFALCSLDRKHLVSLFETFEKSGKDGLIDLATRQSGNPDYVFSYLRNLGKNEKNKIIELHKSMRKYIRG